MRKIIRRIRNFFTVAFARRMYRRAKEEADKAREARGRHHYVVLNPYNDMRLQIIDRRMFRDFKRRYNDTAIRSLVRRGAKFSVEAVSTMDDMKKGAFYSTELTDRLDIEARRRAYIDWVVGLSEKKGGER